MAADPIGPTDPTDAFALIMRNGVVHRYTGTAAVFEDLEHAHREAGEMILAIPFRQALWGSRPVSAPEQSVRRHVSALRVHSHQQTPVEEFLRQGDDLPTPLLDGRFDVGDDEYAVRARAVVEDEIRAGHGSNFVLHRTYRGRIAARTLEHETSLFRSLLRHESGSYWTFLVHFPDHSLVGASPEMHLRRDQDGLTTMNPISGTYRYADGRPEERSLRDFLANPKERGELYMVVDEELKVMSELCDERPWLSEPHVRFMSRLAHTEYFIHGYSTRSWATALRGSLVAPTVLGSPLESAFRMAQRNDTSPRSYLGGVLAHVTDDEAFDSAILIRTACIEADGEVSIPVGSTIVRDSDPAQEAAETTAKVAGVLTAFSPRHENDLHSLANELVRTNRAGDVAGFWVQPGCDDGDGLVATRPVALVVDHEDRFTAMLAAHLTALGLEVSVIEDAPTAEQLAGADVLVLGPGPGDPNDEHDPRIASARALAQWAVDTRSVPVLAVCLSHQLVARALGLEVKRLPRPNQGSQREIAFFGDQVRVGFYNSFSAYAGDGPVGSGLDVSADPSTGEVYALRAEGLIGLQFHPESVLSVDGAEVLRRSISTLLRSEVGVG